MRRRACWYASLPPVPYARLPYLGRGSGRQNARTDIPPRRPYNDGASLPDRTQGGASPRPCRPLSSHPQREGSGRQNPGTALYLKYLLPMPRVISTPVDLPVAQSAAEAQEQISMLTVMAARGDLDI